MRLRYDPRNVHSVNDPAGFGRVAVLFGGSSTERDISLISGKTVLASLQRQAVSAVAFDPAERPLTDLLTLGIERAWLALHGPGGEDGTVQGALEFLGIPYTGSGVMGSAIGMDKLRTKRLAQSVGIPTAEFVVLRESQDLDIAIEKLGVPMIVKPGSQGSSVGMARVEQAAELPQAWKKALEVDPVVFAEPWITGAEYTVAILKGRALPSIRIETPRAFYDYEAKYLRDDTRYFCPSGLSSQAEAHLAKLALAAYDACGADGWGRADFMMDRTGRPLLLEINTAPGMTDHSLVPMAARTAGINFDQLVWQVLETSLTRTRIVARSA
ncbi:MAG TPA: D-alanine--D-alanine ligase [Steroidobacteraceae bacterium]|jgi:D-alanine-D-alanine ligase|nr:D-alanine--D-alanine ligase [Steroidobacteraceae bacterium]